MTPTVLRCPTCSAPIVPPSRFARTTVCGHCRSTVRLDPSVVETARFREAYQRSTNPAVHGFDSWFEVGNAKWTGATALASGARCDLIVADEARILTRRIVAKVARDPNGLERLRQEFEVLNQIAASKPPVIRGVLPSPVGVGIVSGGAFDRRPALLLDWAPGFRHTLHDVGEAHHAGIDARSAIWIWRRLLEVLNTLHGIGLSHGAIAPEHVLIEAGEHRIRLVGFGSCGPVGTTGPTSTARDDVAATARCVDSVLGDASSTPPALRELIDRAANEAWGDDAFALREEIGTVAADCFGPPSFHPVDMP